MKSKSMEEHRKKSPSSVEAGVITLSDSKYKDYLESKGNDDYLESKGNDVSGDLIIKALEDNHKVISYSVIPDDPKLLLSKINDLVEKDKVEVIITTGGTGIGSRDITIETLKEILEKELNGFGEIFRHETYKELGTGAILSRATAGIYKKTLIISMPGSPNAVKLGLKIILPELGHLVKHLRE